MFINISVTEEIEEKIPHKCGFAVFTFLKVEPFFFCFGFIRKTELFLQNRVNDDFLEVLLK